MGAMRAWNQAIVVRLMDGLGNQMFQYALGRNLARLRGVELFLDTSWYKAGANPAMPRPMALFDFSTQGRIAEEEDCKAFWLRPSRLGRLWWRVEQRLLHPRWRRFVQQDSTTFVQRGRMFDERVLEVAPGTYLSGWWISPRYFRGAEAELRSDFVLRKQLPIEAREWIEAIRSEESVGIHVRRGDYKNYPEIGLLGVEYYARALADLRRELPGLKFFLFSDDPAEARAMIASVVDQVEVVELPEGTSAAVDMTVMAACKHFVIANSTFGWWGAWLSQNPSKRVLVPEHWFVGARVVVADVYPENWVRVRD